MSRSTTGNDVEVEGRFVLLELGPDEQTKRSREDFCVGYWRWQLSAVRKNGRTSVTLSPSSRSFDKYVAAVSLKLIHFPENRPGIVQNLEVIDECKSRRCLIGIEFIKMTRRGKPESLLRSREMRTSMEQAQSGFARMLREGILTDITINAIGGSIKAHRAVLAARSSVFLRMFSHNLREKKLSTVDISDMSIDACQAFVGYLYGVLASEDELLVHRGELLAAGDKYRIADLKKACEESLRRDVNTENVLERLQTARTYGLPALRRTCVRLLVDFGKMYEIPEDFEEFMNTADKDLIDEIRLTAALSERKLAARNKKTAAKMTRRRSF